MVRQRVDPPQQILSARSWEQSSRRIWPSAGQIDRALSRSAREDRRHDVFCGGVVSRHPLMKHHAGGRRHPGADDLDVLKAVGQRRRLRRDRNLAMDVHRPHQHISLVLTAEELHQGGLLAPPAFPMPPPVGRLQLNVRLGYLSTNPQAPMPPPPRPHPLYRRLLLSGCLDEASLSFRVDVSMRQ